MNETDFDVEYSVDGNPVVQKKKSFFDGKSIAVLVLIALNAVMFVAELIAGGTDALTLYGLGAKFSPAICYNGEYWRLVASMFLHGGILHLACNMYALYGFGPMTEKIFGTPKFLAVYMISGLLGGLASYGFGSVNSVAVGASGAIFGLMGAELFLYTEHRGAFNAAFGRRLIGVIAINLLLGFVGSGVDNMAHIGGLAGGFLAAAALGFRTQNKPTVKKLLVAVGLFALAAVCVFVGAARVKAVYGGIV